MKRMVCLLTAMLLCLGCALAEQAEDGAFVMAGFDDTQYRTWKDNQFFARMQDWTGVSFEYRQYNKLDEWTAYKASLKAGDEMPDVFFKAALTAAECISLREKGVLVDLKPYLETAAPHLWALLQEYPDVMDAITLPDGSIAALPYISTLPVQNYLWINTAWLKTLHLEEPKNAEELLQVLIAFRDWDPNRNGRSDEIALGFLGPFDLKFLAHVFGMIANDYNVYLEDGQARFMPLDDDYRLFVTWCRDLYTEKLLDPNGFLYSSGLRVVTDSNAVATYGVILAPAAADVFRTSWGQEDYNILMPMEYEGRRVYRDFTGQALRGAFAITTACKDVEAMLNWVDRLYTEEGAVLASIGKENVDYVVDGDGTWRMTDTANSSSDYYSALTLIDGGGSYPGVMADAFQRRYGGNSRLGDVLARQEEFAKYVKMPFPYYSLTEDELAYITPLQNEIGYYVDMQLARWVLGEEEISDASFEAFSQKLEELGIREFMDFWQRIADQTQGGK